MGALQRKMSTGEPLAFLEHRKDASGVVGDGRMPVSLQLRDQLALALDPTLSLSDVALRHGERRFRTRHQASVPSLRNSYPRHAISGSVSAADAVNGDGLRHRRGLGPCRER